MPLFDELNWDVLKIITGFVWFSILEGNKEKRVCILELFGRQVNWTAGADHTMYKRKFATLERETNWGELTLSKDLWDCSSNRGKNWPIADRCVSNNNPRNNCGMHFRSCLLLVSKVAHAYSCQTLDCNFGLTMTGVFAPFKVFFIV